MNNLAILTVIYNTTREHVNMTVDSLKNLPEDIYKFAMINKIEDEKVLNYVDNYQHNDENCLSRAWNKGLKFLFNNGYKYVLVIGTDSIINKTTIKGLHSLAESHHTKGIWSATYSSKPHEDNVIANIEHGDGSFSCFIISKECFEDIGDFDEGFKPAYFEDNDYLERAWKHKYTPIRTNLVRYFHVFQGTVKHSPKDAAEYPKYMQQNLEYFKLKHGKVPDHLPRDIKFI